MAQPSKQSIEVATDALRAEARIWDQQAAQMDKAAAQAEHLRLSRIEAGVFQVVFSAYEPAVDMITARSREGQQRMTDVGNTLIQAANTYDQEEQQNEHRLRNLY